MIPSIFYRGPSLKTGELNNLVNHYRPKNAVSETKIATLARIGAALQDPTTGAPKDYDDIAALSIATWDGTGTIPAGRVDGERLRLTGYTLDGWNGLILRPGDELYYQAATVDQTYKSLDGWTISHLAARGFSSRPIATRKPLSLDYRSFPGLVVDIDPSAFDAAAETFPELISGGAIPVTTSPATATLNADGSLDLNSDVYELAPIGLSVPTAVGDEHSSLVLFKVLQQSAGGISFRINAGAGDGYGFHTIESVTVNVDDRIAARGGASGKWTYDDKMVGVGQWVAAYTEVISAGTGSVSVRLVHAGRDATVATHTDVATLDTIKFQGDASLMRFATFNRHLTEAEIAGALEGLYDLVATEPVVIYGGLGQSNEEGRLESTLGAPPNDNIAGAHVCRFVNVAQGSNAPSYFNKWRTPASTDVGTDGTKWGMQLPFFHRMLTVHDAEQKLAWIKMGLGGQGWVGEWGPDLVGWTLFDKAIDQYQYSLRSIRGFGFTPSIGGLVFMGGEADADDSETGAAVKAELHKIRNKFVIATGIQDPPIFVFVIHSAWGANQAANDVVRTALIEFADECPNAIAIPTEDATRTDPGSDDHFDSDGFVLIGERLADYARGLVFK